MIRVLTGARCQCAACGEYFNSATAFDWHRTGKHGTSERRCMTVDEMKEQGMSKNEADWWITRLLDGSLRKRLRTY